MGAFRQTKSTSENDVLSNVKYQRTLYDALKKDYAVSLNVILYPDSLIRVMTSVMGSIYLQLMT